MLAAVRRLISGGFVCLLAVAPLPLRSDEVRYERAPEAIRRVLDAPPAPGVAVSPDRRTLAFIRPLRYPPIAVESRPFFRLAGLRIDPAANSPHRAAWADRIDFQRVADARPFFSIRPPQGWRLGNFAWSPDSTRAAFTLTDFSGVTLLIADLRHPALVPVRGVRINTIFPRPFAWMPDGKHILARTVPARGPAPRPPAVPSGPIVQQGSGISPAVTYEDLLRNPTDEARFAYYAASSLALIDAGSASVTPFGEPGIIVESAPSPSGAYVLVERLHRPFSYQFPFGAFPRRSEVWNVRGKAVAVVADTPLADKVPIEGVPAGPRDIAWRPNESATLEWVEALDNGDTAKPAAVRDSLRGLPAPFSGTAREVVKIEKRFAGIEYVEHSSRAFVMDYDRSSRLTRTFLTDVAAAAPQLRPVTSLRDGDRYDDPGRPYQVRTVGGDLVAMRDGDAVYLIGAGATPQGRRPFVDRLDLQTLEKTRLFRSELQPLDAPLAILDRNASSLLVARTSQAAPLNYYVRDGARARAVTSFPDATPQLRGIARRLVTYKRADGVDLSFTLYLPPGYKEGTRLPTLLWAYPLEFNDPSVAGQVSDSTQSMLTIGGSSPLFMVLQGYAVLDNASIPIVGDPKTVNDTYVEQLVAGAQAAVAKAVELGVTDPERVAVGGHSYGAFMTANLLAHTRLFRAGIARSGAYNRTLTPFGFQNERRTFWEAPSLYMAMSPFTYANEIRDPLLLIHGMADDNTGTYPIQSERLYAAIRGNGGTARLVMLPDEAHGYAARESIETVLAEMLAWLDTYVKNAPAPPPR